MHFGREPVPFRISPPAAPVPTARSSPPPADLVHASRPCVVHRCWTDVPTPGGNRGAVHGRKVCAGARAWYWAGAGCIL